MINFTLPTADNENDVISFYNEFEKNGENCIGYSDYKNYSEWLTEKQNRRTGKNLPDGYVRENFYLCYAGSEMIGVFSLKFELTEYLLNYGGHIGYAVRPSARRRGYATQMLHNGLDIARKLNFGRIICICNEDNPSSEKVILKNNGKFIDRKYDPDESVFVKRYSIDLN